MNTRQPRVEHAIEQVARALWDYDNADMTPEWRDMAWADMGGSEPSYERAEYELRARALAEAGLIAPAPRADCADAWDECVAEGEACGYIGPHDATELEARNPYREPTEGDGQQSS